METYEDVHDWFDNNTDAPWRDYSELDEDLVDLVDFATGPLLDEIDVLAKAETGAEDEAELKVHLAAALFFYVGHQVANGANLDQGLKPLLTGERIEAFAADPTLFDMTALHRLLDVIVALTSDTVSWPW